LSKFFTDFSKEFGAPTFHLFCHLDEDQTAARYRAKNEIAAGEELSED
jgi:hypothetical protein